MPLNNDLPETPQAATSARLVPRDGVLRAVKIGQNRHYLTDLYSLLMSITWTRLIAVIIATYIAANLVFASIYYFIGNGIANASQGSFSDMFFFSVQTMATIGYGNMYPTGLAANIIVVTEVLTGFAFFALLTGMIFAKFSRPTARVLFSEVAVICPYDGVPHLMLRLANQRNNRIVDANIHLLLLRRESSKEGTRMRRFHDLTPVRSRLPMLQLTWTVMHPIDEKSPLYGMTGESLEETDAEIVISLTGLDETFSQTVHARHSFVAEEVIFGATFEDVLAVREDGRVEINYTRFHQVRKLEG